MNKYIITLLLMCSTYASAAMPADGDSTTAGNQAMRVMTFKAVPGMERTYCYHHDHLGSTTLITNESGEVAQRAKYTPTGETFIEQQDTAWTSPYKFNGRSAFRDAFRAKRGKEELDEETGLLYYGARYFDPKKVNWLSTDRFSQFYPHMNPYSYCGGNPIQAIDYGGDSIVYVNDNHRYVFDVRQGTFGFYDSNGQLYNDDNSDEITSSLLMLFGKPRGGKLVNSLMKTKKRDVIISIFNEDDAETLSMRNGPIVVKWNPRYENFAFNERGDKKAPSFIALAHELLHSEELIFGNPNWHVWYYTDKAPIPLEEMRASMEENIIRAEHFIPQRTNYSLKEFGRFTKSAIPYLPTILPLSIR